jgi:NADPH:quinone reductase-like Zn-dependent oxidoreductase
MRAVVRDRFGPPDVLELREVDEPRAGDGEVLVRVRAASVNPADWYLMTGMPWLARPQMGLRRPRSGRLGVDLAGEVATVGANVTGFSPGEEVFGTGDGTLAEAVAVPADNLARKPAGLSFELAAAVPVAALVLVGAPKGSRLLGPLRHIAGVRLASLPAGQKVVFFISRSSAEDLTTLAELLEAGTVTPYVERTHPLAEAAAALRHLGDGHAQGKLVVTV